MRHYKLTLSTPSNSWQLFDQVTDFSNLEPYLFLWNVKKSNLI